MRLIIMFVAILLAAVAFFITMHFTSSAPVAKDQPLPVVEPKVVVEKIPTVDVYTAKQDIPIGTIITQDMLDIQPWPRHLLLPDMILSEPGKPPEVLKMIARTPFQKGEPIIMNKLANDKDPSFLAASLGEGMRLITVAVDGVSGAGGFVFPGDHVDIIITHDVSLNVLNNPIPGNVVAGAPQQAQATGSSANATPASGGNPADKKSPVTEVLVPDVKVMAVNQKSTAHGGDAPLVPSSVSLEVTTDAAQKIRLAENGNGRLSLALRSLKDKNGEPVPHPTTVLDLSHYTENAPPDSSGGSVIIVRGIQSESVEVSHP